MRQTKCSQFLELVMMNGNEMDYINQSVFWDLGIATIIGHFFTELAQMKKSTLGCQKYEILQIFQEHTHLKIGFWFFK